MSTKAKLRITLPEMAKLSVWLEENRGKLHGKCSYPIMNKKMRRSLGIVIHDNSMQKFAEEMGVISKLHVDAALRESNPATEVRPNGSLRQEGESKIIQALMTTVAQQERDIRDLKKVNLRLDSVVEQVSRLYRELGLRQEL